MTERRPSDVAFDVALRMLLGEEDHDDPTVYLTDREAYPPLAWHEYRTVRAQWDRLRPTLTPIVFDQGGYHCMWCQGRLGDEGIHLTVDHLVPISRGGGNDLENLSPCCDSCNSRKGALTMREFRAVRKAAA